MKLNFAIVFALSITASAPAWAGDDGSCTTAANTGSKVWKVAGPTVKSSLSSTGPAGATAAQVAGFVEKGIKLWNNISGDDNWAKIGPRRLDFDKGFEEGTLIGSTERLFLSGIPATNPVEVDIHKLDHDGKVKVVVCKIPEKGKAIHVKTFTIDSDTPKGKVRTVSVDGAKGNVIAVAFHGKSVAKKLKYKVRARMSYPEQAVTGKR